MIFKKNKLLVILLLIRITNYSFGQETCTVLTSGNWPGGGSLATWSCTGSATVPEDLTGASTVIVPNGINLTIKTNASWDASVIVESGGTLEFDNQLSLGSAPTGCGYTLLIESGGSIVESGMGANDRLFICGETIISSAPNPPEPAVDWPPGGFDGPTGFDEEGEDTTLPVELTYFKGLVEGKDVYLYWETASELNNDYFTLEKSRNGKDFETLGTIAGNGTVNTLSNYSFTDDHPYLGMSFYRLSQTDYDGTTEVFPMISVVFSPNSDDFIVSPNPLKNSTVQLKATGKAKNEQFVFRIVDLQGRMIEENQLVTDRYGNVDTEIQLKNNLRKGAYIFELLSETSSDYLRVISE